MLKASEVLGMVVISLQDGDEVGTVSRLVTDRSGRTVGLVLNQRNWYEPIRMVPYSFVRGISKDAVVIENESSVFLLSELPDVIAIVASSSDLLGLRVLSTAGEALGTVSGYAIDGKSGKVEEYVISRPSEGGKVAMIASDRVVAIGRKVIIVSP